MSRYIINTGEELVFALKAGSTCQPEQFVEYAANIDFWFGEFRHLRTMVSEYEQRLAHQAQVHAELFPEVDATASRDTSSPRERELVVREAREQLLKVVNRGRELQWISEENYNYIVRDLD